ncbi:MAG TPA: glutathione S-transferase family protein [Myxococcales bacterium]|nr:glutathione S-transferase family protein [Myxococcales bacterium]
MVEIHGKRTCPFAWRARICAREKGIPFDWLAFDVPSPDPRALRRNPERKSPVLVHGDFELIESLVILQYLDEAFPGPALQPSGARERALLRLRLQKQAGLEQHVTPAEPPDHEKLRKGFDALEEGLAGSRPWLGGSNPDLSDIAAWPFLWMLDDAGIEVRPAAYWQRARVRESLAQTRPR